MELAPRKIIVITLVIFVTIFLLPKILNFKEDTASGINSIKKQKYLEEYSTQCNAFGKQCKYVLKDCSTKKKQEKNDCTEKEIKAWKTYINIKDCNKGDCDEEEEDKWKQFVSKYIDKDSTSNSEEDIEEHFSENDIENNNIEEEKFQIFNENTQNLIQNSNLRDTSYDIDENIDKMSSEVKKTYENLKDIEIEGQNAKEYMVQKSKEAGINPLLPLTVITQESKGDPNAISATGCAGLFQFCYSTAHKDYDEIFGKEGEYCKNQDKNTCEDDERFDPKKSIDAGIKKLDKDSSLLNDNIMLTLTSYNAGYSIAKQCNKEKFLKEDKKLKRCILKATNSYYSSKNNPQKVNEVDTYIARITRNYQTMLS